jgi:hypothetical protein
MWDIEPPGLDLNKEETHNLVSETVLSVGRESPHVDEDDRMLLKETMLTIRRWESMRTEKDSSSKMADASRDSLMRLSQLKPGWTGPGSWGVWSFAANAISYFVYKRMKADPRFWSKGGAEWCRTHGGKTLRPDLTGYRLCTFADFLLRYRWQIQASPYRRNCHRQCRNPIMTGYYTREPWCSERCRKNFTTWRSRLGLARPSN